MQSGVFLEWLTSNSVINYPFKEDVSLQSLSPSIAIPRDLFLDAALFGGTALGRYYIALIEKTSSDIIVHVADENDIEAGVFTVPLVAASVRAAFGVEETEFRGRFVIGEGLLTLSWANGSYFFDKEATEFEPCVVAPNIRRLFSVNDLEGELSFEEGFNVQIDTIEETNSFRMSAGRGLGKGSIEGCTEYDPFPRLIKFINGTEADDGHGFTIFGSDCIEIIPESSGNMITIYDRCDSCCDCEALDPGGDPFGPAYPDGPSMPRLTSRFTNLDARVSALEP